MRTPTLLSKCCLGLFVVIGLAPSGSQAQVRPFSIDASAFGGVWEGDAVLDTGPVFGARAQFNLNQILGIEATYGAVLTERLEPDGTAAMGTEDVTISMRTVSQLGINPVLHLSDGALTPYLTAGVGLVFEEEASFATNIGLGAKYYFTEMIGFRADLRGWFSDTAPAEDEYAHFEITGGVVLQLGGDVDLDKDGVPNLEDMCVKRAEDKDGFEDEDGCPDPDNDEDGILDVDDRCPDAAEDKDDYEDDDGCPDLDDDADGVLNDVDRCPKEAEDKDGFEDEDGCPDLDNDADGLPDAKDKCPDVAESKNGFEDDDGCPEGDADGDGIFDSVDGCKDKAETVNGVKDADGCPDEVPADLQGILGIQPKVRFSRGKEKWRGKSIKKLQPAVEVLGRYPEVVIVVGVTAHKSKDDAAVSAARAENVKAWLVEQGLDAKRLRAKGLGAAPLPDDAPKRARPDRVELSIEAVKAKP